jgi:hypothetical protein
MIVMPDSKPSSLSPKQLEVMTQLMTGETVTKAARKAKVHRCTIYAWLGENPTFRAHYERLHDLLAGTAEERVREIHVAALEALEDSLCDPHTTPAVRLRAAIYVLGNPGAATAGAPPHPTKSDTFSNSRTRPPRQRLHLHPRRTTAQSSPRHPTKSDTFPIPRVRRRRCH